MNAASDQAAAFSEWIAGRANAICLGAEPADAILPQLAAAGYTGAGVASDWGGNGGDAVDGVAAIAEVAEFSLTAAFILWGQRAYTEYLLQSDNRQLAEQQVPDLLAGRVAGATGLSNAMKFLSGLEPLQISAAPEGDGLVLDGKMPWVTNLRPAGFYVAAAVDRADGGPAFIVSLASGDEGLVRSADLELLGMRSSDTAAVTLENVRIGSDRIIANDAAEWLPRARPAFVGLQCGMSIGLARRALREASQCSGAGRAVLGGSVADTQKRLAQAEAQLFAGLRTHKFEVDPSALFELRIRLAEIVEEAVSLELQASGGRAYLSGPGQDFARRWREAAFIPLITPSLVQLKSALQQKRLAS